MNEPVDDWKSLDSSASLLDGLNIPLQVGDYELSRHLGEGGMGIVYEARHRESGRPVALKLMRQAFVPADQQRRFERESRLLAELVHPNIAAVVESGTHREGSLSIPYYAMELVPQARPITRFADEERLVTAQRLDLMLQACRAVSYAHERRIIHRDLKPGNLLVGTDGVLKLIDLGVAKAVNPVTHTQTRTDGVLGTLPYMSPEQLAGTTLPSPQWDVYALGAVLYELLLGRPPVRLTQGNLLQVATELAQASFPLPTVLDPAFSRDLEKIILKALQRDPALRYRNVTEMAGDLRCVVDGVPLRSRHEWRVTRRLRALRRYAHGHRKTVLAGITLGAAAVCFLLPVGLLTRPLDHALTRALIRHGNHVPDAPLAGVRMISLRSNLQQAAAALDVRGFEPGTHPLTRLVLGRLSRRLADVGARVIAYDLFFEQPSAVDNEFLGDLRGAQDAGAAIVVAAKEWRVEDGPGILTALSRYRTGVPAAQSLDNSLFAVVTMLIDELAGDEPSFAVQALAAARGTPISAKLYADYNLQVCAAVGAGPGVTLTRVSCLRGGPGDQSFVRGQALSVVEPPPDAMLDSADFDLDAVAQWTSEDLRRVFGGKIVVIGDARHDPLIPLLPDRSIFGYRVNALLINQSLEGFSIQWPLPYRTGVPLTIEHVIHVALFLGAISSGLLLRSVRHLVLAGASLTLMGIATALLLYRVQGTLLLVPFHPLISTVFMTALFLVRRRLTSHL